MEFSKYFLDASGVIWFPLQSLIQVPWIQANLELLLCLMVFSVGISWNFLFHYSVTSLTGSKIPSHSKFLISLWNASRRWTGTHLGACLAGFTFGFSWNLYGGPGNFPILVNTSEYTLRMSCFFNGTP